VTKGLDDFSVEPSLRAAEDASSDRRPEFAVDHLTDAVRECQNEIVRLNRELAALKASANLAVWQ